MTKILVTRIGVGKPPLKEKSPRKRMRKSRLNPVNRKRKKRLFEENFGGAEYVEYIRSLPCDICGVRGFSVAAHLKSRGAGGKAADIAPLCSFGLKMHFPHFINGCHELYDAHDPVIRLNEPRLRKLAAARWQSHIESLEKQK